jgi:hypothetical protein
VRYLYLIVMLLAGLTATAQPRANSNVSLQNGSSGIEDTLYFDKKWQLTAKRGHKFYRVTAWEDSLFVIRDHYARGTIQYVGKWLLRDTSETSIRYLSRQSDHHAIGTFWYYYRNGNPKARLGFLPIGQPCDTTKDYLTEVTKYFKNGMRSDHWQEVNRKMHGLLRVFDDRYGKLVSTIEMNTGLAHGKKITFYVDSTIHSVSEYVNGKRHGSYIIYYSYPFRPQTKRVFEHGDLISREEY